MGYTGVSISVMNYYTFIDKSNIAIDFVVPNQVEDRFRDQINGNGGNVYELCMREKDPIRYLRELLHIIKIGKYDLVHIHGNSSILLMELYTARIAGIKIRIAHSHNTTCDHRILNNILRPFFLKSYTHAVACGSNAGHWLFPKKDFTIIPNGVEVEKFIYNEQVRKVYREKYNLIGKKVIGHVGTFNYQKNHAFLIDIFYELSKLEQEVVLFLIGDGNLKEEIQQKVKRLDIEDKVIFFGKTTEVPSLLQAMDLMVLPSRFEGLPVVLIEWQCAGLPCIVSEKVTKEAKITDLIEFMPLELPAREWALKLHKSVRKDRNDTKEQIQKDIIRAGYSIKDSAKELTNFYHNCIEEVGKWRHHHNNPEEILFVSNLVGNGGAGRVMSLIANDFANNNKKVVICSFTDSHEPYQLNHTIETILLKPKTKITFLKKIKRIYMLRKILKKHPKATIISFEYFVNMQTIIAKLFLRNKIIISERNDPSQEDKKRVIKKARDILYRKANLLVCQTPDAKNYFPSDIKKKTVIIPNPIVSDLPERHRGERRKEIVNFCRLEPQKNLTLLIDAFHLLSKEFPEYILSIYGDGSEKDKLSNYIKFLGLMEKVNLYNFTFDIHERIKDCAMFVSSSDYEGISNSMLEAMAMGLPTIVTDCPCGGSRMFIKSYVNGILVPVGKKEELYKAMKYIIQHPERANEISIEGIKIKEDLNTDRIIGEWMEALKSL